MRLTAWEEERLLIFTAAELARRHRERGLRLNAPEAIAVICDAMLDAARAGATYEEIEAAGRSALSSDDVLPGVAALVPDVRLEVAMDDGTRLVVLLEPLGPSGIDDPGAIIQASGPAVGGAAYRSTVGSDDVLLLEVTNTSERVVRVSSHHPFDQVNPRLVFDRSAAAGRRLALPAGSTERWAPGEVRSVALVRYRGAAGSAE